MVTLVDSIGSATEGSDTVRESGISVIRGGLGAGKVVLDLRHISPTPKA